MKRLLIPLLAAIASPTAVMAEKAPYYLIIHYGVYTSSTVPMQTLEGCEAALEKVMEGTNWTFKKKGQIPKFVRGICLKSE